MSVTNLLYFFIYKVESIMELKSEEFLYVSEIFIIIKLENEFVKK
jgi:hypothetical protein